MDEQKTYFPEYRKTRIALFITVALLILSVVGLLFFWGVKINTESKARKALDKEYVMREENERVKEQIREALSHKKIAEQQQQIAEQLRIITDEQKQYAILQQSIAEKEREEAVRLKQLAIEAKDEAERMRDSAVANEKKANEERAKAIASEKKAQRLKILAVARSLAIQSSNIFETGKTETAAILAQLAYSNNMEQGGRVNQPDIFDAMFKVANQQKEYVSHTDAVRSIALSDNGNSFITCGDDGTVRMWNMNGQQEDKQVLIPADRQTRYRCIAVSPGNKYLAAGGFNGQITIVDLERKRNTISFPGVHNSVINSIMFSADANRVISASSDGTIKYYEIHGKENKLVILKQENESILSAEINHLGNQIVYGMADGVIRVINIDSPDKPVAKFSISNDAVTTLQFDTENRRIASGHISGKIAIWSLDNPNLPPAEFLGHTAQVNAIRFSPDSLTFASCSYDRTIKFWNSNLPGEEPVEIMRDSWIHDIRYTDNGNKLISADADYSLRLFTVKLDILAEVIRNKVKRELTADEWNRYIGADVKFKTVLNTQ